MVACPAVPSGPRPKASTRFSAIQSFSPGPHMVPGPPAIGGIYSWSFAYVETAAPMADRFLAQRDCISLIRAFRNAGPMTTNRAINRIPRTTNVVTTSARVSPRRLNSRGRHLLARVCFIDTLPHLAVRVFLAEAECGRTRARSDSTTSCPCRQAGRGGAGGCVRGTGRGAIGRSCRGRRRGGCRGPSCRDRLRGGYSGDTPAGRC